MTHITRPLPQVGDIIQHAIFKRGEVVAVNSPIVRIRFDRFGLKEMAWEFCEKNIEIVSNKSEST